MDTDAKSGQIFFARPVFGNALSETSKGEDKSWPQLLSPSSWRLRAHGHSLPPRGAKDSRSRRGWNCRRKRQFRSCAGHDDKEAKRENLRVKEHPRNNAEAP